MTEGFTIRTQRSLQILLLTSAALVVAAHVWAGMWDEGHPVLHPVGHLTILVGYTWVIAVALSVISLAVRRGRSGLAALVLCIVATDVVLLFTR
jgi:cytochrome bd-type quinol oxidase subunit 2